MIQSCMLLGLPSGFEFQKYPSRKSPSLHTTCLDFALWRPQTNKRNPRLPLLPSSSTIRPPAEVLLLPVGAPAEQLGEAVVLAAGVMDLNADGALPVACLRWPVLLAEQPDRRCEVTIACYLMMPAPQGVHITHTSQFERKLTCGLAFSSLV